MSDRYCSHEDAERGPFVADNVSLRERHITQTASDEIARLQAVVDAAVAELEMIGMSLPHPDQMDDSERAMYELIRRVRRALGGEPCPTCKGRGCFGVADAKLCPDCGGSGVKP